MKLTNLKEAPLIRAYLLINQEKSKKGFKTIQPEINKMTEIFGPDFDKELHRILFDEIDFKEIKNVQNSKNGKFQYFLQDFPSLLERFDFINLFSEILMRTENPATTNEIFNGLNKLTKLSSENQIKILICFILSTNQKFYQDAKSLLLIKISEIIKENQKNPFSENTTQTLLMILENIKLENDENENEKLDNYIEYFEDFDDTNLSEKDDIKQINDIEKILDTGCEIPIEVEKLFFELGPLIINNNYNISNCEMINYDIDEKRLAELIMFIMKHQNWNFDKENKYLNKIFLKSIDYEKYKDIDDFSDKKTITWNIDLLYKMFKKNIDNMDSNQVLNGFDDEKFSIKDKRNFEFFINTLQKINILKNPNQFFNFIFTKWNFELNQIEFLNFLINNNISNEFSQFSFKNYNGRKVKKEVEINIAINIQKNQFLIENWQCIDLTEILIKLSKGNYYSKVKEIFLWPIQFIPEILALNLISIQPESDDFLYDELIFEVLNPILSNHNTSQNLIDEIWNTNKNLVIKILIKMWQTNPDLMNLSKILDISQKLKDSLLLLVSNNFDYNFAVHLAILSVKRDFLHIEQWLKERISKVGNEFIEAILNYLNVYIIVNCKGNNPNKENILEKAQLSIESLAYILENLIKATNSNKISTRIKTEITKIYKEIFDIFEEIQVRPNSEEIENEANNIYQQLFSKKLSVDEIIQKLIKFKSSNIIIEGEIFACMIHSLLDEYRYYYQYPEPQLTLQATFFGQAINNNLFFGVIETIALKYILEAIKKGQGPMFKFGTIALKQFINKIQLWPKYLPELMEIPQIKNDPELFEMVNKKYEEINNVGKENNENLSSNLNVNENQNNFEYLKNNLTNSNKNDKAYSEFIMKNENNENDKKIKNKNNNNSLSNYNKYDLQFFLNNINETIPINVEIRENLQNILYNKLRNNNNKEEIAKEIENLLNNKNAIEWFSHFFFFNRIYIENSKDIQNYNELLKYLNIPELSKNLIKLTITKIKNLLQSENLVSDSQEKNILKKLGNFLGLITIYKNRPILAKDLDLKEILIDAYKNGKLIPIVSFVCKILEYSKNNIIFNINNPWINALLSLLFEIYNKNSHNIKNEIDNLFKLLEIKPNFNLRSSKLLDNIKINKNPENVNDINMHEIYNKINSLDNYINSIINYINSNNNNSKITFTKPVCCNLLFNILKQSFNDFLSIIEQRAVPNSLNTIKELIIKDFMFEKDENKFKSAVNSSIKTLATSLAIVLSKEPLRINVNQHFKKNLENKGIENSVIENIINIPNNDFLEIGIGYINNIIAKKALEAVNKDPQILEEINKRKLNKNLQEEQKNFLKKIEKIPENLKPNKNGLTENEIKVYENFNKIYEEFNIYEEDNVNTSFFNIVLKMLKEVIDKYSLKINKNYELCLINIQNISHSTKNNFQDEEQLKMLERIIQDSKIENPKIAKELAFISLKYTKLAAKKSNQLLLNIYSQLIKGWIKLFKEISKEITLEILNDNEIDMKFNKKIHECFLKKEIFDVDEYEKIFFEFLKNKSTQIITQNLLIDLYMNGALKENLFKKIPNFIYDKINSKDFFIFFNNKNNLLMTNIFQTTNKILIDNKFINSKETAFYRFKDLLTEIFIRIMNNVSSNEDLKENTNLLQKLSNIVNNQPSQIFNERLNISINILTELCIKGPNEIKKNSTNFYYYNPENLSKFIFIILYSLNSINKLSLFHLIILNVIITFFQDYIINYNTTFNQRLYYKFFYNLISIFSMFDNNKNILNSEYKNSQFIMCLSDHFKFLSPSYCAGFAIAWLDLISSKNFVSVMLSEENNIKLKIQKYEKYLSLNIELLKYLKNFSDEVISNYNYKIFLENVYKYFFILCESYPDFVCGYYFLFLTTLPGNNYIQLKNLLLSACPKEIIINNPFNENINNIENQKNAKILFDNISSVGFKEKIDEFVNNQNENILNVIVNDFNNIKNESEKFYHISRLVIYLSQNYVPDLVNKKINSKIIFNFFKFLILNFNNENRDHLINAILNELRYPSKQTFYFSLLLKDLLTEINNEIIEENILKNLIERLFYKPHPWGLVFTFNNVVDIIKKKNFITKNNFFDIIEILLKNCKDDSLSNFLSN